MIADNHGLLIADRKKFCDLLRSYWNTLLRSSAILQSRSPTITEDRTTVLSSAIVCDRLRSSAINWDRAVIWKPKFCDLRSAIKTYPIIFWIPTHDSTPLSNKARIFAGRNRLFVVNMAGVTSVSNEEFTNEVARCECVYHSNSKNFKWKRGKVSKETVVLRRWG